MTNKATATAKTAETKTPKAAQTKKILVISYRPGTLKQVRRWENA